MPADRGTGSDPAARLLVTEGAGYTVVEIIQQALALAALPVFFFFLTAEDFGVVTMSMVLTQLGSAIGSLGLDFSLMRLYFRWAEAHRARIVAGVTLISCAWSVLAAAACHLVLSAVPVPAEQYWPLTLGWWSGLILAIRGVPLTLVRLKGDVRTYARFVLGGAVLQVVVQSACVIGGLGVFGYMLGYALGALTSVALALAAVRGHYIWTPTVWRLPGEIVSYAAWILPSVICSRLIAVADRLVLSRWVSTEALGVYGAASRFTTPVKLLSGGFKMALAPVLSREEHAADLERTFRQLGGFVVMGMLLVGSVVALGVWFLEYTPWAAQATDVQRLVALLLVAQLLSGLSYLGQLRLYYSVRPGTASIVVGVNAVVLVGGLLVLVPAAGPTGAAVAELAAALASVGALLGVVLVMTKGLGPWPGVAAPLLSFTPCVAAAWMPRGVEQLGVLVCSVAVFVFLLTSFFRRYRVLPVPGLPVR